MRFLLFVFCLLICLVFPAAAHAHGTIRGLTGFANGLVHPALVPGQLLALMGLGLALGQQGYEKLRPRLYLFGAGLCAGLLLSRTIAVSVAVDSWLLPVALVSGLCAALQLPAKWADLLLPLALVTGLLVGAGSSISPLTFWQSVQAFVGSGISAFVLVFYFAGLAGIIYMDWPSWVRIGVRVVGSWIAALSLLVLALAFVDLSPPGGLKGSAEVQDYFIDAVILPGLFCGKFAVRRC